MTRSPKFGDPLKARLRFGAETEPCCFQTAEFSWFPVATVAELFDPSTESWSMTNPTFLRGWGPLALLPSGLVMAASENSSELYDPATGMWSRRSNLNAIQYVQTLTVLRNGLVLATGGRNGGHETGAELYDPATGTWQLTASPAQNRSFGQYTATLMPNGHVLVAGGGVWNAAHTVPSNCTIQQPVYGTRCRVSSSRATTIRPPCWPTTRSCLLPDSKGTGTGILSSTPARSFSISACARSWETSMPTASRTSCGATGSAISSRGK